MPGGISGFGGSYLPARYERGGRTGTNINYCRNRGAITSSYIGGGLTGVCDAFVITNSENYGTVSSTTLAKISFYPASRYETLMLAAERSVGGLIGACIPIGRKAASYYDPICTIFNCANHTSATLMPDNADAGGLIGLITTKYSAVQDLWLTLNVQNCYQASSINALSSTSSSGFTPVSGSLIGDCTVTTATLEYCYAVQSDPESADVNSTCFGTQSGKLALNAVENISGKQLLGTETEKNIGSDLLTQTTALLYCLNGYINSSFRYDQTQWISKQSESEEPMLVIDDYTLPTEPPIVSFAPEKTTSPVPSATGTPARLCCSIAIRRSNQLLLSSGDRHSNHLFLSGNNRDTDSYFLTGSFNNWIANRFFLSGSIPWEANKYSGLPFRLLCPRFRTDRHTFGSDEPKRSTTPLRRHPDHLEAFLCLEWIRSLPQSESLRYLSAGCNHLLFPESIYR